MAEKEYSYTSGERQTALTYDAIRRDHTTRYELAAEMVLHHGLGGASSFGLDVFCGNGYGTHHLGAVTGTPMMGIDGSAEAIAVAGAHFSSASTLFVHKLFPFSLPKERFRFITSFESLEHVGEDATLLSELVGALEPHGLIFVSAPNQELLPLTDFHSRFHVRHYHHTDVVAMLDGVGVDLLETHGQHVYTMRDGRVTGLLEETEMGLRKNFGGQFLVFAGRKRGRGKARP